MDKKIDFNFINSNYIKELEMAAETNFLSEKELVIDEIDGGVLLPYISIPVRHFGGGGGIMSGNKYYFFSPLNAGYAEPYFFNEEDVVYDDSVVVFIGMFASVWGHCLTDNLKHLWFLLDNNLKRRYENYKFVYTTFYDDFDLYDNFTWMLSEIGVEVNKLQKVTRITRFRKIYLPDSCFFYDILKDRLFYTKEYIGVINRLKSNVVPNKSFQKIYFSRKHYKVNNRDMGEEKIEKIFEDIGYKIIFPEELTVYEQIAILKGCTHFAATEGSISHNMIFLNNSADAVIIRKADYINIYQVAINQIIAANVTYVDAHKSTLAYNSGGPFFLYPSKELLKFTGGRWKPFPIFQYFAYMGYISKFFSLLFSFYHFIRNVFVNILHKSKYYYKLRGVYRKMRKIIRDK